MKIISDILTLYKRDIVLMSFISLFLLQIAPIYVFYSGLILVPYLFVFKSANKYIDAQFIIILCYSVIYSISAYLNGFFDAAKGNLIFYSIYPPLFYLIGRILSKKNTDNIYVIFFIISTLFAIGVIYDVIVDINRNQFINPTRRIEFADGTLSNSATLMGMHVSLAVASMGLLFSPVQSGQERLYKILFIIVSVLGCMCIIHLINRTGLIILAISIITIIALNFNKKYIPYLSLTIIVIIIGFILISSNPLIWNNIESAYISREDDKEYGIQTGGGRTELWKKGIENIFIYPTGYPNPTLRTEYCHNYWLDTSSTGGDLSLLFLLLATFIHIKKSFFLIKNLKNVFLRSLIIVFNIAFFLTCFVEPVMEGSPIYIFMLYMFAGINSELYRSLNIQVIK